MENKNAWSVSSESIVEPDKNDLRLLAGLWSEHLHVTISFPAVVTDGPVCRSEGDRRPQSLAPRY